MGLRWWALGALALLACVLVSISAASQGLLVESKAGVQVPVPAGFTPIAKENWDVVGIGASTSAAVEHVFQAPTDGAPVIMFVFNYRLGTARDALAELPGESGPLPQRVADALLEGMLKTTPPGLRQNARSIPLLYDNERKAYGVEVRSDNPSIARAILQQPLGSPDWQEIIRTGADPGLVRCLLTSIAQEYEANRPSSAPTSTSKACKVEPEFVVEYIKEVTPETFAPQRAVERLLNVITDKGNTIVRFGTAQPLRSHLDAAWSKVWSDFRILESARPSDGPVSRVSLKTYKGPALVGMAIGSFIGAWLWGSLVAWALLGLPMRPWPAALLGVGTFVLLSMIIAGETRGGSLTGKGAVRIAMSLAAVPLVLRFARKKADKNDQAKRTV